MADRNEVFRIILEGRDRLSKELDSVRAASDKLDQSLQRLKRNKPDEFPLFGGGKTARGPGGQFIKKEEIAALDRARQKVEDLNRAIQTLRRGRIKEGEFALFGGGRAIRGEDGRFIRVQDVTLLEKAKSRLDAIDKTLVRIRTRIRRGPLVEGEEAGAGATRLVRTSAGQFARAQDLTFIRRIQRELAVIGRGIRDIQKDTRNGLFLGAQATIQNLRRVAQFADTVKQRISDALTGGGRTRVGVDEKTGRFISIADVNNFQKFVLGVQKGANLIVQANNRVADSQRNITKEIRTSFKTGFDASRETKRLIDERVANTREELRIAKANLQEQQELDRIKLSADEDAARNELFQRLEAEREQGAILIEEKRRQIRRLGQAEDTEEERIALRAEIRAIQRVRRLREAEQRAALGATFQAARADQRLAFAQQRREIDSPDITTIEKEAIADRQRAINSLEGSLAKMGARAGLAFGDIVRGAQSARKGVGEMDRDIRLVNNTFTRFGFAIGSIFKNFGQLVNLRWLFLTGILTTFFTLIVQIGTALVALAASAIQAGAAIGGAFLAGVAQALPVVGLLAAALGRFNAVLDQVKLNEKLDNKVKDNVDQIAQASQRLSDSQYTLKKALEAVADAQHEVVEANQELKDSHKAVRDATEALRDAKVQAARDIVDANLEEKDAALALAEAELGVLEAKKKLREEQKKAKAGVGDADEARAALREAQERLKIATQQGDQSEISSAQQQLTIAEQNLNAVLDAADSARTELKDAELGVKRAVLTVEQARVRNKRARDDAKTAREEGIQGSEVVKTAQDQLKQALEGVTNSQRSVLLANRNVRDSLHQVAIAQREVADARKEESDARAGQSQADKDAQAAFADLAPAEKKLFNALTRLRKVFKDVFVGNSERDGILGPITEAIARFAETLTNLLLDPQIQRAAENLAQTIAGALDSFREFVSSSEFKEALLFFTQKAADNIPRIVEGMLNLTQAFLDIAKAANPIFDRLIEGAVGLTGRLREATSQSGEIRRPEEGQRGVVATINESGLDKFLGSAEKHLDAWLSLSGAIINLIAAITGSAAAGSGKTLLDRITDKLNEIADWIRENPESVQKFFDDAVESISNLASILGRLGAALIKSFSSEEFQAFAQVIAEVVIPGLLGLIFVLGKASQALLFILELPVVGDIVKFALAFLVFEKGLNKLFPVTQKLTQAVKSLVGVALRAGRVLLAPGGLRAALDAVVFQANKAWTATKRLGTNLLNLGQRWASAAATGATKVKDAFIAMGNAALGAAKKIATVLWAALSGFAKLIYGAVLRALLALRLSIRALIASTGIGALIVAGLLLIENWDKVKAAATKLWKWIVQAFKFVTNWVRDNWKRILVGALLAPFLLGGAILIGIYKFRSRILGVFTQIKDGIINRFKAAIQWVRDKFGELTGWVGKTLRGLPGIGRFFGGGEKKPEPLVIELRPADKKAAEKLPTRRAGGGVIAGSGVLDSVPALLTPGEWVLNKKQQSIIAKSMGTSVAQARAMIFGTKSNAPPGQRARNNGLGKRVQRYSSFNLVSQEDDSGVTVWFLEMDDGSFGQVTSRDATKIQNSNGTWIPNYVKRNAHGFTQKMQRVVTGGRSGFSMGGIVTAPGVQRFAQGGVVQAPGGGGVSKGGNTINQNFDVKTQGETDWGYVMRLGAVHAQESF